MNIFYVDYDIEKNVVYHCDRHVIKMILESAQLLCSVHHSVGSWQPYMYKATHINHPDALWSRTSLENYAYLYSLAILLGEEYTYRYGKVHKSIEVVQQLPIPDLPDLPFSHPPKCVHDDFKNIEDTVEAYRAYYKRDKAHFCTWKYREIPYWFKE